MVHFRGDFWHFSKINRALIFRLDPDRYKMGFHRNATVRTRHKFEIISVLYWLKSVQERLKDGSRVAQGQHSRAVQGRLKDDKRATQVQNKLLKIETMLTQDMRINNGKCFYKSIPIPRVPSAANMEIH